jgi:hypothetical protein
MGADEDRIKVGWTARIINGPACWAAFCRMPTFTDCNNGIWLPPVLVAGPVPKGSGGPMTAFPAEFSALRARL